MKKPGNEPAFARPLGFADEKHDVSSDSAGLTKYEYARIIFTAALLAGGRGETNAQIAGENIAEQMFPTK